MKRFVIAVLCLVIVCCSCASGPSAKLPMPIDDSATAQRSETDPRVRKYILPVRVVWHSTEGVENPGVLLQKRTGQVTLDASDPCILRTKSAGAGLLLDFGVELHGGVQIMGWHSKANKPVRLRVRFGESVSEAMAELAGEKNATNDHAIRDQSCLLPWLGTAEIGNTGFRFVRIDLEDPDSFVQLKSIRAVFLYRDIEYKGTFRCSDQRLNRIWNTGAYTVHLNMQDYLWDGIKRDRLVWIGDMHPETMTICSVFGYNEVVPKSLDLIRDETPLPKWMNGISSYSMWWVLIHHSWYIHGDFGNYCYKGFRHSLCHGWASGPTAWMTEHILGVKIVEPGCKVIEIDPHLVDLDWAEGTFPTPAGVVRIRHDKQPDGSVKSSINAPHGVRIIRAKE